jgi:hypothetical protein
VRLRACTISTHRPITRTRMEHHNGTVVATIRSMLKIKGLPRWFWDKMVSTAMYKYKCYKRLKPKDASKGNSEFAETVSLIVKYILFTLEENALRQPL